MKKYLIAMIAALGMGTLTPAFADSDVFAGAILGGAAGAAIGHQFEGRHREAVGAVIGAGIGASIASDNSRSRYAEPRYVESRYEDEYRPYYRRPPQRVVIRERDDFYAQGWHDRGRHRGWYKHHRGYHEGWRNDRRDRDDWRHDRGDHDWHGDRGDDNGRRDDWNHRDRH